MIKRNDHQKHWSSTDSIVLVLFLKTVAKKHIIFTNLGFEKKQHCDMFIKMNDASICLSYSYIINHNGENYDHDNRQKKLEIQMYCSPHSSPVGGDIYQSFIPTNVMRRINTTCLQLPLKLNCFKCSCHMSNISKLVL